MDTIFSTVSVILVAAATIFLVTSILQKKLGNHRNRLPPGPRAIPVIGHLHLLRDKTRPTHHILNSLSSIHGPLMHLKFGSVHVLVISSSDLARECFTVNDKAFASRPRLARAEHLGYNYSMLGWAPYGPFWRNARKICVLELLSSKRIQSFGPKRMKEISKAVNSLFQQSQLQSIVNMRSVLSQLTFNIMMAMIVDERYFGEHSGISVELVTRLIKETYALKGVICVGDYIPWLKWLDLQGYEKAMKKIQGKLDLFMQRILDKHRNGLKEGRVMEDFIDVLISQAEENCEAIPDKDVFIKATALRLPADRITIIAQTEEGLHEAVRRLNINLFSDVIGGHAITEIESRRHYYQKVEEIGNSSTAIIVCALHISAGEAYFLEEIRGISRGNNPYFHCLDDHIVTIVRAGQVTESPKSGKPPNFYKRV